MAHHVLRRTRNWFGLFFRKKAMQRQNRRQDPSMSKVLLGHHDWFGHIWRVPLCSSWVINFSQSAQSTVPLASIPPSTKTIPKKPHGERKLSELSGKYHIDPAQEIDVTKAITKSRTINTQTNLPMSTPIPGNEMCFF